MLTLPTDLGHGPRIGIIDSSVDTSHAAFGKPQSLPAGLSKMATQLSRNGHCFHYRKQ